VRAIHLFDQSSGSTAAIPSFKLLPNVVPEPFFNVLVQNFELSGVCVSGNSWSLDTTDTAENKGGAREDCPGHDPYYPLL